MKKIILLSLLISTSYLYACQPQALMLPSEIIFHPDIREKQFLRELINQNLTAFFSWNFEGKKETLQRILSSESNVQCFVAFKKMQRDLTTDPNRQDDRSKINKFIEDYKINITAFKTCAEIDLMEEINHLMNNLADIDSAAGKASDYRMAFFDL